MEVLFIPLGLVVGMLGTLIGVGGGIILVPVLLVFYPQMRPDVVTAVSLAMVFANSLSGSIAYARMGRIKYKAGLIFAAAAVPGSVAGAFLVAFIHKRTFDAIFGAVMLIAAVYLVLRPKIEKRPAGDHAFEPSASELKIGAWLSAAVGFVSSILGIGGGIVHVPVLIYLLEFPVHLATATSHFVLAIMSGTVTIVHLWQGAFEGRWLMTAFVIAGVLPGAQIGAWLSGKLHSNLIIRILAVTLGLSGVRILLMAMK